MKKPNGNLNIELSERELDYLQEVHRAQALKELTKQPGWEIYTKIVADMIARLEDQHLNFATSLTRDAYWASGIRLGAARQFAKILQEQIAKTTDILNHPLRQPQPPDISEFDGELEKQ